MLQIFYVILSFPYSHIYAILIYTIKKFCLVFFVYK